MKKIISICIVLIIVISSCKKKNTCNCSTLNSLDNNIYINEETYQVKEKSKTDAQISCSKMYEASGKAPNGVNCDVK